MIEDAVHGTAGEDQEPDIVPALEQEQENDSEEAAPSRRRR